MEVGKINNYLRWTFLILLFILIIIISIKFNQKGKEKLHLTKHYYLLNAIPGPPFSIMESYGFLPEGKVLVEEMKRRGVPSNIALMWGRAIRNLDIYNIAGDWFLARWDVAGEPLYFEYKRDSRFMVVWKNGRVNQVACGVKKVYRAEGGVTENGLYWSMRREIPAFIINQFWRGIRTIGSLNDFKKVSHWRVLYTMKGRCPSKLLFFQITYGSRVTETGIWFPFDGIYYWNENGKARKNCHLPPVPLDELISFNDGFGFLRTDGYIFAPFNGKVLSVSPIVISNENESLLCQGNGILPGYLKKGSMISRGSVIASRVTRFQCKCKGEKLLILPDKYKKKLQLLFLKYVSLFE